MKNLKEKQFLVNMALSLGQTPDPALVKELEEHKKIMDTVIPMGEEFSSLIAQLKQLKDEVDTIRTTVEVKQQYFPEEPKEFPKPPTLDELMASLPVEEIPIEAVAEEVLEEPTAEVEEVNPLIKLASEHITKEAKMEEDSYQQPTAPPTAQNFKEVARKLKFLEEWIAKISLTGPGGGAGDVITLDHPVKVVSSNYTFTRKDYYVGVNASSTVNITIPDAIGFPGRMIIIKDESGNCSSNPIVVSGTVDNDTGGFILAQNNGGIQMIYREGWRIV
jgi:hypothetical protein